ncbi:hypothetical protein H4R19_002817 [Coemansia spiralis]|nr:hypothetical protein H4R19_002817 [Coemansia spiralis]
MSSSSADTLPEALQSADLFDFPAPPSQHIGYSRNPSASTSDSGSDAEEPPACQPAVPAPSTPPPAESEQPYALRFARASRSTTSLPAFLHRGDGTSSIGSMPRNPLHVLHARAAQSHHHLPYAKDSGPLSQSLMSLTSRGEQVSDMAELLTPIEYESCEFGCTHSSETSALASQAHEPALPPPALAENVADFHQYEYRPPSPSHPSPPSPLPPPPHQREPQQLTPLLPRSNGLSRPSISYGEQATFVPPVGIGMAQHNMGIYRNSMVVGNVLFPGLDAGSHDLAPPAGRRQAPRPSGGMAGAELAADIGSHRASRYLYDVPGSSSGGSIQGALSRALQWSQRISQGPPHRLHRTRSSIVDQHKIYDIYEESIWHTAQTPATAPGSAGTAEARIGSSRFHFGLGGRAAALEGLRSNFGHRSVLASDAASGGGRANVLRSVKSAGVPWSMIRSWKNRDTPGRTHPDWNMSSTSSDSSYSQVDCCSTLSDDDDDDDQDDDQDAKGPLRKHSTIHLLVKRAGHGLLRRSASFYRSISGTTLVAGAAGNARRASHSQAASSGTVAGHASQQAGADTHRRTFGRRLASAMRLASGKLTGPWRTSAASPARSRGSSDIVSAYPADESAEKALDAYLSMSSTHSPVLPAQAGATMPAVTAYVPPKRPPYLGLHRKSIIDQIQGLEGAPQQAAPAQPHGGPTRVRSTQFKSPFTTLPYGALHQTLS